MKKIFGILVAVSLCLCMLIPAAATDVDADTNTGLEDILGEYFGDFNINDYSTEELEAILADLDLGSLNADELLADFLGEEVTEEEATDEVNEEANDVVADEETTAAVNSVLDISWLTNILSGEMDTDALTEMFSGFEVAGLDDLLAVISESMSGAGVDLGTLDLASIGNVDVATLLSSAGSSPTSYATTDLMAGLADTILSGLESLGLDTTTIEALLDNEIVNFFANLYIGYVDGVIDETTTQPAETTTKVPAVVTTEVPKTGDTSSLIVAIATLSVASAAAFVCLKKKEN